MSEYSRSRTLIAPTFIAGMSLGVLVSFALLYVGITQSHVLYWDDEWIGPMVAVARIEIDQRRQPETTSVCMRGNPLDLAPVVTELRKLYPGIEFTINDDTRSADSRSCRQSSQSDDDATDASEISIFMRLESLPVWRVAIVRTSYENIARKYWLVELFGEWRVIEVNWAVWD